MRGFKVAKGYEKASVVMPGRSTEYSAGYDFTTCKDLTIEAGRIERAETGVKAFMMDDEVLKIYPRSSLPVKFGVTIPNNVGIIDADYFGNEANDGAIFIQLLNFSKDPVTIPAGTRIAQGVFTKYLTLETETPTNRKRKGGFGSTG